MYEEADLEEGDKDEEERRGAEATFAGIGRRLDVTRHHLRQAVVHVCLAHIHLDQIILKSCEQEDDL